ncbi:hypothetical protein [Nocardia sp. NPDC058666]|uniref:hypothetical protein n=1 Tax=Nocardia sp. NPDC058666 TaxID=3346587 RepID=UPI0036604B66
MSDLAVNQQALVALGVELNRIGTALEKTDCHTPFRCGIDDLKGTATAAVSAAAVDQVRTALNAVASRIHAMGGAAIRCSGDYEAADREFAALLNTVGGGVYS